MSGDKKCEVKVNEKELAARAGLSRETVSREMHKLIKAGMVTFDAGVITIDDIDAFEAKLDKVV